jgi:hypothetical protein
VRFKVNRQDLAGLCAHRHLEILTVGGFPALFESVKKITPGFIDEDF